MPSSNTARLAALSRPLAVIITSVAAPPRCGKGRSSSPASTRAAYVLQTAAISACNASVLSASRRPLASARSISAASRLASAEPPFAALATGFGARRAGARERGAGLAVAALGNDINLVSLFDHLVLAQLELAVGDALAGFHIVFVAVPGAHEMHFGLGKVEPLRGLVRQQPLFDLGDG